VIIYRLFKDKAALVLLISIATIGAASGRDLGLTPASDLRLVAQGIILDLSGSSGRSRSPALATLATSETAALYHASPASTFSTTDPSDDACQSAPSDFTVNPTTLRKPPLGRRADINVRVNRLLSLDFSPFDAQLLPHDRDLTLIFDDDSVIVLHRVTQAGKPVTAAFRLPDGSIISLCELLAAVPQNSAAGRAGSKIPQLKIPHNTKIPAE